MWGLEGINYYNKSSYKQSSLINVYRKLPQPNLYTEKLTHIIGGFII